MSAAAREGGEAPAAPPARTERLLLAVVWLGSALLFAFLATLASFYDRFPADERISHGVQSIDVPAFGGFLDFVNVLGYPWFYLPSLAVFAAAFAIVRARREAILVAFTLVPNGLNSLSVRFGRQVVC